MASSHEDWYMAVAALSSAARACATTDPLDPLSDCNTLVLHERHRGGNDVVEQEDDLASCRKRRLLREYFSDALCDQASAPAAKRSVLLSDDLSEHAESDAESGDKNEGKTIVDMAGAPPSFLAAYLRRVDWIEKQRSDPTTTQLPPVERVQRELRNAAERRKLFSRKRKGAS